MDVYKKVLEYEEMLKDGVISEAEFQKLKTILYSAKMSELGIEDEAEYEDYLKKDVFREAILMLENDTAASYREAVSWLEKLGDWGNAAAVTEQARADLLELEKKEAEKKAIAEKAEKYKNAIEKMSTRTSSSYKEAIAAFESLGDWEDSKELLEKCTNELQEINEEQKKQLVEKELKKIKRNKKIAIIGGSIAALILAVVIVSSMIKPDLMKFGSQKTETIHNMDFKVPDSWVKLSQSNSNCNYYACYKKGKTIAVLAVAYKGDTDLSGEGGYDAKSDEHYTDEYASKEIQNVQGVYKMIEADNSAFEACLYCDPKKVRNSEEFLDNIGSSFTIDSYSNPRVIEDVIIDYKGSTEAGAKVAKMNLDVTAVYDTGGAKGEKTPEWDLKEPVTFEAGKTSTITVVFDGKEYSTKIKCSTEDEEDKDEGSRSGSTGRKRKGTTSASGNDILGKL